MCNMCNIDVTGSSMATDIPSDCRCHCQQQAHHQRRSPTSLNPLLRKSRRIDKTYNPDMRTYSYSSMTTTRRTTSLSANNHSTSTPPRQNERHSTSTSKPKRFSQLQPEPPSTRKSSAIPWMQITLACIAILTLHSVHFLYNRLVDLQAQGKDAASTSDLVILVWCSGWITAVSTGIGAAPFFFIQDVGEGWVGLSNAVAAGMMLAASAGLLLEAATQESGDVPKSTCAGFALGLAFILTSETVFDSDHHEMMQRKDLDMRKVILIMAVMTLHSFSEGVAIGVAYQSQSLGGFITTTLAIHNIPEGLALSIVLIPNGMSKLATVLWCIFSSIPQPLMAVPAFLFAESFKGVVPVGLGFAAGAMIYVAMFELYADAYKALSGATATGILLVSAFLMTCMQACV